MLDTLRTLETPEGIDIELHTAGPVARGLAWAVDFAIRAVGYLFLIILLASIGRTGTGLFLISAFLIEWFYPVLFEVLNDGVTPGKSAMGLQVLHDDGTPVGWGASITRNLLRAVDILPFFYLIGVMAQLSNPGFQRLGDLAAGTLVVYREKPRKGSGVPAAAPLPPPLPLDADEQHAIVRFAERLSALNPERAEELAGTAQPLSGATGAEAVKRLLRMANWLVGRR